MASGSDKFIMPFFYKRFLSSTQAWSDEEVGAYVRLLVFEWDNNQIPQEMQRIKRIAESAEKNWKLLKTKFCDKTEDGLQNPVMEEIRAERARFNKKQRDNGAKGGRKTWKNNPKGTQTDTQRKAKSVPKSNPDGNPNQQKLLDIEPLTIDYQNIRKYLNESQKYNEDTCMKFKLTMEELKKHQEDFLSEIQLTQEVYPNIKKGLSHFIHWLKHHLNNKKAYKNNGADIGAKVIKENTSFEGFKT